MTMLDRIKKKQLDGFKEFVLNMEITSSSVRQQIFLNGVLEDPLFMGHVLKNLKTFDNVLDLPTDELDQLFKQQDSIAMVFAKSLYGSPAEKITSLEKIIPKWISAIRDELAYLTNLKPEEQEVARFFVMKAVRKLQNEDKINGFSWQLPPLDVFYIKSWPDGRCRIQFESGVVAAEGEILKGKRLGHWRHYYDTGKLLAEGEYSEGLKSNMWVFYHGNGMHKSQGKYKADVKVGFWKEWDRSGVMSESEYQEGVKVTQSSSN